MVWRTRLISLEKGKASYSVKLKRKILTENELLKSIVYIISVNIRIKFIAT